MRLLDTNTGHFVEKDPKYTKYAILSHTWDKSGEQTYKELRKIQKRYGIVSSPLGSESFLQFSMSPSSVFYRLSPRIVRDPSLCPTTPTWFLHIAADSCPSNDKCK